jgi:hypothetical protein
MKPKAGKKREARGNSKRGGLRTPSATERPGAGEAAASWEPLGALVPWAKNPRRNAEAVPRVAQSLIRFGWGRPLVARAEDAMLVVGHTARLAALSLAALWKDATPKARERWHADAVRTVEQGLVPVRRVELERSEAEALAIADNRLNEFAQWDELQLIAQLKARSGDDQVVIGFDAEAMKTLARLVARSQFEAGGQGSQAGTLAADYGEPPFSVLDTRSGRWQARKRQWLGLGLQSEIGRGENLLNYSSNMLAASGKRRKPGKPGELRVAPAETGDGSTGTSIFDPVLCELLVAWHSGPGALVLDPFAGGSVRGIVCAALGRDYFGAELRGEQVKANRKQWKAIGPKLGAEARAPEWEEGDALAVLETLEEASADLVLSCPPYMDLECYSEDPRDLSTLKPEAFEPAYAAIIAEACRVLRPDRFACFVVSEVRGPRPGWYRQLPAMTVRAFEAAGARYYGEAILLYAVSSLPLRMRKQFEASRKLGRVHQNVLIFCKGDPEAATKAAGKVSCVAWSDEPPAMDEQGVADAVAKVGGERL